MIWEKNICLRNFESLTSKLALVCRMKISEAWYALHAIANMDWTHGVVSTASGICLYRTIPSHEVTRPQSLTTSNAMTTHLWWHSITAMVSYSWAFLLHTSANLKKSMSQIFSNILHFLETINSVMCAQQRLKPAGWLESSLSLGSLAILTTKQRLICFCGYTDWSEHYGNVSVFVR